MGANSTSFDVLKKYVELATGNLHLDANSLYLADLEDLFLIGNWQVCAESTLFY
jgi:hypothetical protein